MIILSRLFFVTLQYDLMSYAASLGQPDHQNNLEVSILYLQIDSHIRLYHYYLTWHGKTASSGMAALSLYVSKS